jgi:hypothetical protein
MILRPGAWPGMKEGLSSKETGPKGPDLRVSGVGCQVSGKRNKEAETCWSEAEIPSEAKRQRGTLKPETSVFVIPFSPLS